MQKIIILGAPRSGTSYLKSLLNSHPNIQMFGEVFNPNWKFQKFTKCQKISTEKKIALIKDRLRYPKEFLENFLWMPSTDSVRVIGFKLLYGQDCDVRGMKGEVWKFLRDNKDIKIIHLKRKNLLKREISFAHAMRSGRWSVKVKKGFFPWIAYRLSSIKKIKSLSFDPKKCEELFLNAEKSMAEYENYFFGHQILSLDYEELLNSHNESLDRVIQFLKLESFPLQSRFCKQNIFSDKWSLKNYGVLKKYFKGSRWESFFLE